MLVRERFRKVRPHVLVGGREDLTTLLAQRRRQLRQTRVVLGRRRGGGAGAGVCPAGVEPIASVSAPSKSSFVVVTVAPLSLDLPQLGPILGANRSRDQAMTVWKEAS